MIIEKFNSFTLHVSGRQELTPEYLAWISRINGGTESEIKEWLEQGKCVYGSISGFRKVVA